MRAKFIYEAVIPPNKNLFDQFKQIFLDVKNSDTYDPFYDLNQLLNPLNIFLVDYEKHFEAISPEERKKFERANIIPELGIRILGFDPPTNQIFIVVDKTFDDKFIRMSNRMLERLLDRLWSSFGHETIHMQQVDKMKVKQDPEFKAHGDYYEDKQEIMAMAFSFIEEMRHFHSDEEIMDLLKTGTPPSPPSPPPGMRGFMPRQPSMHHPLYTIYKRLGGKTYKLFTKYAYQYLTQENE
jgi:hypothetical protein